MNQYFCKYVAELVESYPPRCFECKSKQCYLFIETGKSDDQALHLWVCSHECGIKYMRTILQQQCEKLKIYWHSNRFWAYCYYPDGSFDGYSLIAQETISDDF